MLFESLQESVDGYAVEVGVFAYLNGCHLYLTKVVK